MQRKIGRQQCAGKEQGRVLARVLAEDLRRVRGVGEGAPSLSYAVTAPPPGWDYHPDPENL